MMNVAKGVVNVEKKSTKSIGKSRGLDLESYGCNSEINSAEEVSFISTKQIRDAIFPSIEEIYYCVKNNLVSKKEQIIFKLLIDLYEAIQTSETAYHCVSCQLKFYKSLENSEVETILAKMQSVSQRM